MKYQAKPVIVDAMQYDGTNAQAIDSWSDGLHVNVIEPSDRGDDPEVDFELLSSAHHNWVPIRVTDWVVRKENGEYMRVNDETFKANYTEVE